MADRAAKPDDLVISYAVNGEGQILGEYDRLTDALKNGYRVLEVFQTHTPGVPVAFVTVVLTNNVGGLDIPYLGHKRR